MSEKKISKKVLTQIKDQKIEPKTKFNFAVKDCFVWLMLILFLIIGSLATSVIIYMIENGDWDLYKQLDKSFLGFVFATLPYFWMVILLLFTLVLYYAFKYTSGGYKFHAYSVIITTILLSIVLGLLFYNIGLAHIIDDSFNENVPLYNKYLNNKQRILMHPEMGILTGKVYQVIDNNSFKIMDLHGGDWLIFTQNEIERIDLLKQGLPLIIIGQQKENGIFEASQIRPLIRKTRQFFHQKTMPMHLNLQIERKIM